MDRRSFIKSCLAAVAGASGSAWLSGCGRRGAGGSGGRFSDEIPGVIRRAGNVFLFENHNVAHLVWHAMGVRGRTVVHVDTHDDFRHVEPAKLRATANLLKQGRLDEIFRMSDLEFSMAFQVRPADQLFDLGNFLFPCVQDGTISELFWVVPEKKLESARMAGLARHFQHVLRLASFPVPRQKGEGLFELDVGERRAMTICTLDALPSFPRGALLDLDVDFFAFPHALADEHLPGALMWDPSDVCRVLRERVPNPAVTTVCSSVWGGYLPVMFRFLADACFDFMVSGGYPAYADMLLEETVGARTLERLGDPPEPPADDNYRPAWCFLGALLQLARRKGEEGMNAIEEATKGRRVYQKGLLDAAEAFLIMGLPESAEEALARFDHLSGCATTGSKSWRVRVLMARGDLKGAEDLSRVLIDWDRQPFSLMLYGGVLTEERRFEEAAVIYAEVIQKDPANSGAYYNMGVVQDRQGNVQEALEYYQKALALRPWFADAHENLGYLLLRQKRLDEAIAHFRETVRISPLKVKAWGNLGLAHSAMGDHEKAVACFRRAISINPGMAEMRYFLARELAVGGRMDEAAAECREAIRLRSDWMEPVELLKKMKKL